MFMNERDIEIKVEKMTDRLDRRYMAGEFDEAVYQSEMRKIDAWADEMRCFQTSSK